MSVNPMDWSSDRQPGDGDPEPVYGPNGQPVYDTRSQAGRVGFLQQALNYGASRAQQLTGQGQGMTGMQVQDILRRRREMVQRPSVAAEEIRRSGQNLARKQRAAGASEAQQRQTELDTARRWGVQADMDYERRLGDLQDTIGNIMRTQGMLEPAYGQLAMSTIQTQPEARDPGLLGGLLDALGL